MSELHGQEGMVVDKLGNSEVDFLFGSSGPCILEEYQVKVEE
jgi:hypothetical protein